jgi:hypothetical protein
MAERRRSRGASVAGRWAWVVLDVVTALDRRQAQPEQLARIVKSVERSDAWRHSR